jgi:hypothetical protein
MNNNFDSKEELYFSWYLEQLKASKYINGWERNETSYNLFGGLVHSYIKPMKKVEDKVLTQTILHPSSYTPDFVIYWEPKAIGIFVSKQGKTEGKILTPFICSDDEMISIVETKGIFDMGNMTRLANNNIKFVYEKYKVYINMIKVPTIFDKTFTPDRFLMTDKTFQPRKLKYKNVRTIREFIESVQK